LNAQQAYADRWKLWTSCAQDLATSSMPICTQCTCLHANIDKGAYDEQMHEQQGREKNTAGCPKPTSFNVSRGNHQPRNKSMPVFPAGTGVDQLQRRKDGMILFAKGQN
jgi:hypothetical protein